MSDQPIIVSLSAYLRPANGGSCYPCGEITLRDGVVWSQGIPLYGIASVTYDPAGAFRRKLEGKGNE